MKRKLLLIAMFIASTIQFSQAQCERTGSFVQSDPAYAISGTGKLVFETNGDKSVVFDNDFMTVQGADLRVYLSKQDDILTSGADAIQISGQLENDAGGFGGSGVSPITGMMNFDLPSNVELDEFDFIVIQCIVINERWGHVTLGNNEGADCGDILSVEDNSLENAVSFFPNPLKDKLNISNQKQLDLNIKVYNILGDLVLNVKNNGITNQTISLASLNSGVYLVQLLSDNQQITKRLIKE